MSEYVASPHCPYLEFSSKISNLFSEEKRNKINSMEMYKYDIIYIEKN
jgi:hypothetical protein